MIWEFLNIESPMLGSFHDWGAVSGCAVLRREIGCLGGLLCLHDECHAAIQPFMAFIARGWKIFQLLSRRGSAFQ